MGTHRVYGTCSAQQKSPSTARTHPTHAHWHRRLLRDVEGVHRELPLNSSGAHKQAWVLQKHLCRRTHQPKLQLPGRASSTHPHYGSSRSCSADITPLPPCTQSAGANQEKQQAPNAAHNCTQQQQPRPHHIQQSRRAHPDHAHRNGELLTDGQIFHRKLHPLRVDKRLAFQARRPK